jgi:hypothetical protein
MRALQALFVGSLLSCASTALAGPWTHPAGHFYANISYSRISATKLYAPNFEKISIVPYSQQTVGVYGEVGVIDRWLTLSADATLYRFARLQQQGSTRGFGDLRLGAWSGLSTSPIRLALGVFAGIPTGDSAPDAGASADEEARSIARSLPTGDGEWDAEARLAAGYSLASSTWPLRHYFIAELGYSLRTRGISDGLTYNAEVGTQIPVAVLDRFWLVVRLRGLESFASNEEAGQNATGLGQGVTYASPGVELNARVFGGLGLAAGVDTALRGRSIAAAPQLRFALSYAW